MQVNAFHRVAASTFHLYVSLASLDVNTFQVSLPFLGRGDSQEFRRQTTNVERRASPFKQIKKSVSP